jgi:hypothetical protein
MDHNAWEAGRAAGLAGNPDCPYRVGTIAAWSWRAGYIEGKGDRGPGVSFCNEPHG